MPVTHKQFKVNVLIIKNQVNWLVVHTKWLVSIMGTFTLSETQYYEWTKHSGQRDPILPPPLYI